MTNRDTIIYCGLPMRRDHVAKLSSDPQSFAMEAKAVDLKPMSIDAFLANIEVMLRGSI